MHVDLSALVVVLERTTWFDDNTSFLFSYLFLCRLPNLLYILAGAWASRTFWQKHHT